MIVINKSGYLKYKNFKFRCALGKHGISEKKKEGDKITPKGIYKIVNVYYRQDRIKKISSQLKLIKIKKNMGWCDDPDSKNYNDTKDYDLRMCYWGNGSAGKILNEGEKYSAEYKIIINDEKYKHRIIDLLRNINWFEELICL